MTFPTNVPTGTVVGRLLADAVDTPIPGEPVDGVPAGVVVEFAPELPRIPAPAATPDPVMFLRDTLGRRVFGVLDNEGYLCTPQLDNHLLPNFRGVKLIATDGPALSVQDWQWTATVRTWDAQGRPGKALFALSFIVPAGGTVDLTNATRAPFAPNGTGLIWFGDTEPPAAGNYTIWVQPDGTWLTLEAS